MSDEFERLSGTDQDIAKFLADGGDIESLLRGSVEVTVTDTSMSVPFEHDDGTVEHVALDELLPLERLRTPFAQIIALRTQEIEIHTLGLEMGKLSKFVRFLRDRRRLKISLGAIDNQLLTDFRDWLDTQRSPPLKGRTQPYTVKARTGDRPWSVGYKREIYRTVVEYLRRLRVQPDYREAIRSDLDLNTENTWKKRAKRDPVPILTRPELKLLVRLCREEVVATTNRLRAYWAICDGQEDADHTLVDPALAREVSGMATFFGPDLPPPCKDEMRVVRRFAEDGTLVEEFSKRQFPLLWAMNGPAYQDAIGLLYPSPAKMLPFCLLFAVYFRYNPGVLGALKGSDLKRQPSVFGERLHGTPFKNRAKRKQHASWPITDDAHNPAEMIKTIGRWVAAIKDHAPEGQSEHLFLFRDHVRAVQSFTNDGARRRHVAMFFHRHNRIKGDDGKAMFDGKLFSPRSIRPSVIDLVHHLFDGDVVAASHAGQHRKVDTTVEHYLQDGARKRNDESLAPVIGAMQTLVETNGRVDPRNMGASANLAATPGWECDQIDAGHIAGEEPGIPCRAYGRCVSCELGKTRFNDPLAYALAIKLSDAIKRARTIMPEHAWLERWQPELDLLERLIALKFTKRAKAQANLAIPELPTVE